MGPFGTAARRICAVVAERTAAKMVGRIRAGSRETRTVELRLDWLRSDAERARLLRWLKKNKPRGATFLATCRRRPGGGQLAGDVQEELHWLRLAREAGCQWCDLEIETLQKLPEQSVGGVPLPPRVLPSFPPSPRPPPPAAHPKSHSHLLS